MHPDRKIGFAMGILLIGIVGALFFRNEPLTMDDLPTVRREKQLNDQLRARDISVYISDTDTVSRGTTETESPRWTLRDLVQDLNSRNHSAPLPVGAAPEQRSKTEIPSRVNSHASGDPRSKRDQATSAAEMTDHDRVSGGQKFRVALNTDSALRSLPPLMPGLPQSSPDDRIAGPMTDSVNDTGEVPDLFNADQLFGSETSGVRVPAQFQEYKVQYGDTLSHLAERFLGSQGRFQEIFDANRDRISAPDKLQIGKMLRIPVDAKP